MLDISLGKEGLKSANDRNILPGPHFSADEGDFYPLNPEIDLDYPKF